MAPTSRPELEAPTGRAGYVPEMQSGTSVTDVATFVAREHSDTRHQLKY